MTKETEAHGQGEVSDFAVSEELAHRVTRRRFLYLTGTAAVAAIFVACNRDGNESTPGAGSSSTSVTPAETPTASQPPTSDTARPAGWSDETHSNDAEPNYDVVLPRSSVPTMTIAISPENWDAMLENMTDLFGERGSGGQGGAGGFQGAPPGLGTPGSELPGGIVPGGQLPEGVAPGGQLPEGAAPGRGGFGGPGGGGLGRERPMWVPGTISFGDATWTNVGVRFKGNSSLSGSWRDGTDKLPFKLDFDQFEDDHPEIHNQRFHGFKQLSLGNSYGDATAMREVLAYDLIAASGLPAARAAAYEIVLDRGDGPLSLGLYTVIEVIDDTVVGRVFGSNEGNLYDANGSAASFAAGTKSAIETSFEKKNNEAAADWSDIEALYDVIHSEVRTADAAAWRSDLQRVFEVDGFLRWLALSAIIQHWDTYGAMTHNYYLYHATSTDQLTWISWDHNFVLGSGIGEGGDASGPGGGAPGGRGFGAGGRMSVALDRAEVTEQWPLIRFVLDDPTYAARYHEHMKELAETVFISDDLVARLRTQEPLLAPFAEAGAEASYADAVDALAAVIVERGQALDAYLA